MSFADIFALVLVIIMPLYGLLSWRRFSRWLAERRAGTRHAMYAETLIIEWGLVTFLLIYWISYGASAEAIGLRMSGDRIAVGVFVVAVAASAFLLSQVKAVRAMGEVPDERLVRQMSSIEKILPHDEGERAVFMALSVTAGFCEELLYRGFLITWAAGLIGLWGGVVASALVFGLLHAYQGPAGIVRTGIVGLVMGILFALSGSIWPAVVLHAALDIQGGLIGYEVMRRQRLAMPEATA